MGAHITSGNVIKCYKMLPKMFEIREYVVRNRCSLIGKAETVEPIFCGTCSTWNLFNLEPVQPGTCSTCNLFNLEPVHPGTCSTWNRSNGYFQVCWKSVICLILFFSCKMLTDKLKNKSFNVKRKEVKSFF